METVLVAPNLPVPLLLGGDYLWRHRCLADYFNAQFITRAVPQNGSAEVVRGTSHLPRNASSMGSPPSAPLPLDHVSSPVGNDVPEAQQSQSFTLFAADTITVDPHSQMVIRVPHAQTITDLNVVVEPAFTLFRHWITAASVLATLDKPWIPVMLRNTTNHRDRLPRSFSLVHCAVLEDQRVLCGCSIPGAQGSK